MHTEKNQETPAFPWNKGIRFSIGEYIMFVDSDDAIIEDALEVFYKNAKKFDVDVVLCERRYKAPGNTITTDKNLLEETFIGNVTDPVNMPTLESPNFEDRIRYFAKSTGYPWNKLIKRKLLIDYDIKFPPIRAGQDQIFSFFVTCLAENILKIPNPLYVWRKNDLSITYSKLTVEKMIHRWTDSTFRGIGITDKFMDKFPLFHQKPEYRFLIFETFISLHMSKIIPAYAQIPAHILDKVIRNELEQVEDKTTLTAFIFSRMNVLNLQLNQSNAIINQMNAHIQKQNQVIQQLQAQVQSLQAK